MNSLNFLILLTCMLFCHIVDDYYLQGILAHMKQKEWWQKNASDEMYKNDYKVALICHGFSWAFVMSLPLLVTTVYYGYSGCKIFLIWSYIANAIIHAFIDNLKANTKVFNLVEDQLLHCVQILTTGLLFYLLCLLE